MNKILEFVDYNKFPLVTKLTEMNSVRVYAGPVKLQVGIISMFIYNRYSFDMKLCSY